MGKKSRRRMTKKTYEQRILQSVKREQEEKEKRRKMAEVQRALLRKLITEPEAKEQLIKIMRGIKDENAKD